MAKYPIFVVGEDETFVVTSQNLNKQITELCPQLAGSGFDSDMPTEELLSCINRNTSKLFSSDETSSSIAPEADQDDHEFYKLYRLEREAARQRGIDLLNNPRLNKGMAFGLHERQYLGIHGLLPPAFMTRKQQIYRVITQLRKKPDDLARYVQLDSLQDRNEKLYYSVICENLKEVMPIVYTPTVGLACQKFGNIYRKPKGLYITINDNSISKIHHILSSWPETDIRAIVVTDGERILGLGDLGAYGIGIPVGKLALYVALGGIQPKWCLPVLLDVGTDNEALLNDHFYTGLRRKRARDREYETLLDNFMKACQKRYGQNTLIQFEDFANRNAYSLLDRYKKKYTVFNDDIQGTASVALAGLLACSNIRNIQLSENKFVFFGAGGAATGIAELCVLHMCKEGLSREQACERLYFMDVDGLITKDRKDLSAHQLPFAKDMSECKDLSKVIEIVQPTGIIGASTAYGAFTAEVLQKMAKINSRPIVFALSNPTNSAECTANEAYHHTDGRVLFASGSPFEAVYYNGSSFEPSQGNNAYIFPGVALGVILFHVRHIDDESFLIAAKTVAESLEKKDIDVGRIYPPLESIREISVKIAVEIARHAYENVLADFHPMPDDIEKYVRANIYSTEYDEIIDTTYSWPENDMKHGFPIGSKECDIC